MTEQPIAYWYTTCPRCDDQGGLVISKNITFNCLYLHCEECEAGYRDPQSIVFPEGMFCTLDAEFEGTVATLEDIQLHGWSEYALFERN